MLINRKIFEAMMWPARLFTVSINALSSSVTSCEDGKGYVWPCSFACMMFGATFSPRSQAKSEKVIGVYTSAIPFHFDANGFVYE